MKYYVYVLICPEDFYNYSEDNPLIKQGLSALVPEDHPRRIAYNIKNMNGGLYQPVTGGTDPSLINTTDCFDIRRYSTIRKLRATFVSRVWKTRTDWSRK